MSDYIIHRYRHIVFISDPENITEISTTPYTVTDTEDVLHDIEESDKLNNSLNTVIGVEIVYENGNFTKRGQILYQYYLNGKDVRYYAPIFTAYQASNLSMARLYYTWTTA